MFVIKKPEASQVFQEKKKIKIDKSGFFSGISRVNISKTEWKSRSRFVALFRDFFYLKNITAGELSW